MRSEGTTRLLLALRWLRMHLPNSRPWGPLPQPATPLERLEAVIGDKSDHLFSQATYVTPAHKLGPYIT